MFTTSEEAKKAGWHSRRHVDGSAQAEHEKRLKDKIKSKLGRAHKAHPPGQKPNPPLSEDQYKSKRERENNRGWKRRG